MHLRELGCFMCSNMSCLCASSLAFQSSKLVSGANFPWETDVIFLHAYFCLFHQKGSGFYTGRLCCPKLFVYANCYSWKEKYDKIKKLHNPVANNSISCRQSKGINLEDSSFLISGRREEMFKGTCSVRL